MIALSQAGCIVHRRQVGNFITPTGNTVKIGSKGEADLQGHRPDGRCFYIEVKLPGQNPRADQEAFLKAMKETGALTGVARSVDDALRIIGGDRIGLERTSKGT